MRVGTSAGSMAGDFPLTPIYDLYVRAGVYK